MDSVQHLGLLRIRHRLQVLVAPLGNIAVCSHGGLAQPLDHGVPGVDGADVVADGTHYGLDGVAVALITERDNLLERLA